MKLPELPEPAMVYLDLYAGPTRCYNETQLIEYGLACAEAMREACAAECEGSITTTTHDLAKTLRALEIEG